MHYRTLSVVVTVALLLLLFTASNDPSGLMATLGLFLSPILIVVLAVRILRAPGVDKEPPARNKWYYFD